MQCLHTDHLSVSNSFGIFLIDFRPAGGDVSPVWNSLILDFDFTDLRLLDRWDNFKLQPPAPALSAMAFSFNVLKSTFLTQTY